MAQKQRKISRLQKIFGWLKRHKISTVFVSLFLGIIFYLIGSWAVLQIQIHFERERFKSAQIFIEALDRSIRLRNSKSKMKYSCSYVTKGAIFETKSLGCDISADINFPNKTIFDEVEITTMLKKTINQYDIKYINNDSGIGKYDKSNYTFKYKGLSCGFSTSYFDNGVTKNERYDGAEALGADLYVSLGCSGPAKAEYFPVVNN